MEADAQMQTEDKAGFCSTCGAEESGFFCRACGSLLHGEDMVLCPRCHQVVPGGDFCNQCGQSLSNIALKLRQLAMAGDAFWVTSETDTDLDESALAPSLEPDESVELDTAELPNWLQELTSLAPPDVEDRIYPSLEPIAKASDKGSRSNLLTILVLAMFVLMLGMIVLTIFIALGRAG